MTVKETLDQTRLELQHNIQIISNRTDRLGDKIINISNKSIDAPEMKDSSGKKNRK